MACAAGACCVRGAFGLGDASCAASSTWSSAAAPQIANSAPNGNILRGRIVNEMVRLRQTPLHWIHGWGGLLHRASARNPPAQQDYYRAAAGRRTIYAPR